MKKQLAVLLLLVVPFITACGRDTTTPPSIDSYAPLPVAGTHTPDYNHHQVQTSGHIHPLQDFNGQTITVAALSEGSIPTTMLPSANDEPDPATSDNYPRDRRIWNNARQVERDFNFIIEERIERGTINLQSRLRTAVLAGEFFADIIAASTDITLNAALGEWIIPLCEIDLPNSDLLGAQLYTNVVAEGLGHAWAFNTSEPRATAFMLGVNLDIVNAAGMPNPVDLYNQGLWTWDAWLEIMRATTRGNHYGIAGLREILARNLIAANDGMLMDDNFDLTLSHPATVEAIEFMETIMVEELWTPPYELVISGDTVTMTTRNTHGITAFTTSAPSPFSWRDPESYNFAVVPLPIGPSNTSGYTGMDLWSDGLVLPRGSAWTPENLLAIMEEYFSWAGFDLEMIADTPLYWIDGKRIADANAIRQINAISTMRLDFIAYMPGFAHELERFLQMFDSITWPNIDDRAPALRLINNEHFQIPFQRELDRVFR